MTRLRMVDRYYIKAQKIAFPHSVKLIGPFETQPEAWARYTDLRDTKAMPECSLTTLRKRVPLAQAHPKGEPPCSNTC